MDIDEQQRGGRQKFGHFEERTTNWDMVHQQFKERNSLCTNRKVLNMIAERDAAIEERNNAVIERQKALAERQLAIAQRNLAIKERNDAVLERDAAFSALQQSMIQTLGFGTQHGLKKFACSTGNQTQTQATSTSAYVTSGMEILEAFCKTMVASESSKSAQAKRLQENQAYGCAAGRPRKGKHVKGDLNRQAPPDQMKLKYWNSQNIGLTENDYDGSLMPVPGCSCTGVFRLCYKWGKGGWQSSCCTNNISAYPLPARQNQRYGRVGGRKMSGSAFSKLLSRLAIKGFDFSRPVDLKEHWSKHGTNRYITIK